MPFEVGVGAMPFEEKTVTCAWRRERGYATRTRVHARQVSAGKAGRRVHR